MSRIVTPFRSMTDSLFETKATSINASMDGNPNFPNPVPALLDIQELIGAYGTALTAALTRDRNAAAAKNDARKALTDALIQLASSVTTTANGDRTMLISSGFDLGKVGEKTPLAKPGAITLTDGINAGELVLKVPAVKGAKGYAPQYTEDPLTAASEWTQFMTTTCKYTFKNLISSKKYWCRIAAIGAYNQVTLSDAICRVVQ